MSEIDTSRKGIFAVLLAMLMFVGLISIVDFDFTVKADTTTLGYTSIGANYVNSVSGGIRGSNFTAVDDGNVTAGHVCLYRSGYVFRGRMGIYHANGTFVGNSSEVSGTLTETKTWYNVTFNNLQIYAGYEYIIVYYNGGGFTSYLAADPKSYTDYYQTGLTYDTWPSSASWTMNGYVQDSIYVDVTLAGEPTPTPTPPPPDVGEAPFEFHLWCKPNDQTTEFYDYIELLQPEYLFVENAGLWRFNATTGLNYLDYGYGSLEYQEAFVNESRVRCPTAQIYASLSTIYYQIIVETDGWTNFTHHTNLVNEVLDYWTAISDVYDGIIDDSEVYNTATYAGEIHELNYYHHLVNDAFANISVPYKFWTIPSRYNPAYGESPGPDPCIGDYYRDYGNWSSFLDQIIAVSDIVECHLSVDVIGDDNTTIGAVQKLDWFLQYYQTHGYEYMSKIKSVGVWVYNLATAAELDALVDLTVLLRGSEPEPSPTPSPTSDPIPTPSPAPSATPTATATPTPSPTVPAWTPPVASAPAMDTLPKVTVDHLWVFLYEGDFVGASLALMTGTFQSVSMVIGVLSMLLLVPLYIRTRSLMLVCILWFMFGGFLIIAMPIASSIAVLFMALGIGGTIFKLFRPSTPYY